MASNSNQSYHHLCKLVVIGDSCVGKSCLLLRYVDNEFPKYFVATIGIDFKIKTIKMNDLTIKLQLFDMSGGRECRLRSMDPGYLYRGKDGIIIVADVTDIQSFINIQHWKNEIDKYLVDQPPIIVFGNKMDLLDKSAPIIVRHHDEMVILGYIRQYAMKEYNLNFPDCLIDVCLEVWLKFEERITTHAQLSYQDAKLYADKLGLEYIETSAKTGENVETAFHAIISQVMVHNKWIKSSKKKAQTESKYRDCVLL